MPDIKKFYDFVGIMMGKYGLDPSAAHPVGILIMCIAIGVIAVVSDIVLRKLIRLIMGGWVRRSPNTYDDVLYEKGVFEKLSRLGPAFIVDILIPIPLASYPKIIHSIDIVVNAYIIAVVATVIISIGSAAHDILSNHPIGKNRSLMGYFRVFKASVIVIACLLILSLVMNRDIGSLLAGITAFAAVLMIIFKDLILGLVAGIQISSSDIIRIGDYIEMPGRFAEGTVTDIRLNLVKVTNSNMTICVIPAYAFVSEPFLNWRGAEVSGSRRIKRSVLIDQHTIRFIDNDFISSLREKMIISDSIAPEDTIMYERGMTNVGVYCGFLECYLRRNVRIDSEKTILAHQLQGGENGLPVEILAYSLLWNGPDHERLQNSVYEFCIAILPEFGLRVFQRT